MILDPTFDPRHVRPSGESRRTAVRRAAHPYKLIGLSRQTKHYRDRGPRRTFAPDITRYVHERRAKKNEQRVKGTKRDGERKRENEEEVEEEEEIEYIRGVAARKVKRLSADDKTASRRPVASKGARGLARTVIEY
ncbi:hypothetical protein ALC53_10548 [Atta colombica]|uniref:Uncharacterized protein n=1 Tax=Atta colombica TaxID=520822 RepID=A0A195B457_9HYME|nr:hypothetical protein ALC53_10548 [Atta colombica]